LRSEKNYLQNQLDGPSFEYFTNGKVKLESYFKEGGKEGVWKSFDEEGNLLNEMKYSKDKLIHD
jgi:antitoxin component YwqK of YwqJK toxin-antitoxin module